MRIAQYARRDIPRFFAAADLIAYIENIEGARLITLWVSLGGNSFLI